MPAADPQPAASATGASAQNMHMHVDGFLQRSRRGGGAQILNSGRSDLFIENQMPISYFVFQRRGLNLHLPSHVSPAPLKNKIKQEHRFSINRPLLTELKKAFSKFIGLMPPGCGVWILLTSLRRTMARQASTATFIGEETVRRLTALSLPTSFLRSHEIG